MAIKLTKAAARKIKAKWDAEDPLLHYVPATTLARAGESKSRYICVSTKNQVGKTSWMQYVTSSILRNRNTNWVNVRPIRILLVIPTRAQAADVWGNRMIKASGLFGAMGKHPWIPTREVKRTYNSFSPAGPYPGKIVMKNGNELITILSGVPNSWKALEGITVDMVIRDEVAGTENLGDELQPRLLASRTRALAGMQPWGGVMIWAATETKYNEEWLAFKNRCLDGAPDHICFRPEPSEAEAYISMAAREEMRNSMSASSYKIRGVGNLDAGDLVRIFVKQWDDKRHMQKTDYALKDSDNIMIGWDPGTHHPTGIVIAAITKDAACQIKVVKCFRHTNESIEFDAERIHSFLLGRKIAGFVYDWAAKAAHKGQPSLLHLMIAALEAKGYVPLAGYIQADKRVEPGINSFRHYLDPNPFDSTVQPLFVVNSSAESGGQMLRSEIMGYCKTEPTGTSPGKIVKKNDDLCFVAQTMVRMADYSQKPIIDVIAGDMVSTPRGPRKVLRSWMSNASAQVSTYTTVAGRSVTCTPGHCFWANNNEWRPIDSLRYSDTVAAWTTDRNSRPFITMGSSTIAAECLVADGSTKTETASSCIASFTPITTVQSMTDGTSITLTTTPSITQLGTLSPLVPSITAQSIAGTFLSQHGLPQRHGTVLQTATSGTESRPLPCLQGEVGSLIVCNAGSQERSLDTSAALSFVATTANLHTDALPERTLSAVCASRAGQSFSSANTCPRKSATDRVTGSVQHCQTEPVYDIEVDEAHCFYANDLLAHNCDPSRYLIRSFPSWSSAYSCGRPKFEVLVPMETAPTKLPAGVITQTMEEYRAALSRKLANRNRSSVRKEFSYRPTYAIQ